MAKQVKTHSGLLIFFSLLLFALHYALGAEKIQLTALCFVLMVVTYVISINSITKKAYPNSCRKKMLLITVRIYYAIQAFWLITLIIKSLRLPLLYENLILTPLLIGLLAMMMISGITVYKMRVGIEKGTYKND
ncbi:MAG: hypothetical protein IJQ17_05735 [Oscillospiraceae bacterium]|nr:hypothetical protein [Oscillospiraceae bacterium]